MSCIIQECLPLLQTLSLQLSPVIVSSSICAVQLSLFGYLLLLLLLPLLLSHFSVTPSTEAHQVPPSLGFSRQEHWSGLPFPSPM